jgi:hypothetical protein
MPEIEGCYDLIVSNATLEHLDNLPVVFARLRSLAAPRARMAHHVDGQTHMRYVKDIDPLNILRYDDRLYRILLSYPGAPNRLRSGDFLEIAREAGWANPAIVPARMADESYMNWVRVTPRYRSRPDLAILTFTLTGDAG